MGNKQKGVRGPHHAVWALLCRVQRVRPYQTHLVGPIHITHYTVYVLNNQNNKIDAKTNTQREKKEVIDFLILFSLNESFKKLPFSVPKVNF